METRIYTRLNNSEKEILKNLAMKFGMTISDYIKCKLFDHNSDLLEEEVKYICPHTSQSSYFLAFSQIRIQRLLKEILLKQEGMDSDRLKELWKEDQSNIEEVLSNLGYKKITKN